MSRLALIVAAAGLAAAAMAPGPARASDLQDVVAGNNHFAFDLYAQLRPTAGNLAFSPYSISTALAMTWAGARGETAAQMAKVLHFGLPPERLHPAFAALAEALPVGGAAGGGGASDPAVDLTIANRLWGREDEPFLPAFLATVADHYGGGFESFGQRTPAQAAARINDWVAANTNDRIRDIVSSADFAPLPPLVLANAIWFRGDWATQFDSQRTCEETFFAGGGREVTASLMHRTDEFSLFETALVQVLELPYDGDRFSMLIALPRERDALAAVEKQLSAETLDAWLAGLASQRVDVALPRFRLGYGARLREILADMGMPLPFLRTADFSGMNGQTPDLFIEAVIHEAFVEVNEEGTEAAAATIVKMKREAVARPVTFRADHPFLFLIRDRETGSVLFLGRVADPSEEA